MKKILFVLLILSLQAHAQKSPATKAINSAENKAAIAVYQKKDYKKAASAFFKIAFSITANSRDKIIAKYFLGLSLMKLKLYQTAAYPLMIVSRDADSDKIRKSAFENLVTISDQLDDNTLLDYSLTNLKEADLSGVSKELFYSRLGLVLKNNDQVDEAITNLKKVLEVNPTNEEALYLLGIIYLKQNKMSEGLNYLEQLYDKNITRSIRSAKRGAAIMALGRGYYQSKRWADATALYREISKDNPMYRQAQKELTWSLFRMTKFRSAMSTVQTLHTPYYENFYDPESLQLRSIILLFICQTSEVEKSLNTFEQVYVPTYNILSTLNSTPHDADFYAKEIAEVQKHIQLARKNDKLKYQGQIPLFLVRSAMDESPLRNKLTYLKRIKAEQELVRKTFLDKAPTTETVHKYALRILELRVKNTEKKAGEILGRMLAAKELELSQFVADMGLLKYEMLNAKKSEAHTKYVESINNVEKSNNSDLESRNFFTKNGYRYWPFEGEHWKDEIGNYQYMGDNRCEVN